MEVKCPICRNKCVITKTYDHQRVKWYNCELCGYFSLEGSTFELFNFNNYKNQKELIFAINKLSNKDNYVNIDSIEDLDIIVNKVNFPNRIQDKLDLLIQYLYDNKSSTSRGFALSEKNCLIFGIRDKAEIDLVFTFAEDENLLSINPKFAPGGGLCFFASNGIKRAEDLLIHDNKEVIMNSKKTIFFNNCFLVHGRNNRVKNEVARFIENDLKKEVIILHEKPSRSKTIIEKIESHSNVDFAVCLYTADDVGSINEDNPKLMKRARQNVVFEAGYFIGKLGRENVIILIDCEIEKPSDNDGIIYIFLEGQWKDDIRKEVNAIYSVY